jgi:hypothetical protein
MSEHNNLIDSLGGNKLLCRELGQKQSTISNWRRRGVPWRWRPTVARLAKEKRIQLPNDFFNLPCDGEAA